MPEITWKVNFFNTNSVYVKSCMQFFGHDLSFAEVVLILFQLFISIGPP